MELIPGPDDLPALLPDDLHQLRHLLLPPAQLLQHGNHREPDGDVDDDHPTHQRCDQAGTNYAF